MELTMPLKINVKCMNKYSYVIMNKYSFVNIINLEATRKLFLQLFSKIEENFFYLLVFTKYFNVNYRKEKATGINQSPKNILTMYEYSHKFFSYLQAFFTKKDREDTK